MTKNLVTLNFYLPNNRQYPVKRVFKGSGDCGSVHFQFKHSPDPLFTALLNALFTALLQCAFL